MTDLPINAVLQDVQNSLNENSRLILQAPPGAGKSTRVPLSLLDAPYLEDKIIIMLEPRRVAARMVATQMANLLGEELGERVGYQVKMDSVHTDRTKILVVTEAILVRMLQADQILEKVALVIFDEFHERSVHSDLSLALCLQVQELLREDLKILIMSATLNAEKISSLLGSVPVVTSEGKTYEVEMNYLDIKVKEPSFKTMNALLQKTVLHSLKNDKGDILVFLQGVKEIKNLQKSLKDSILDSEVLVLPLYSALSKKEQDAALLPSKKRKVILATNIAQTSLTIEGVRIVIDSGLEKLSRFNYSNGMNHLESAFISKDSATQRAGRAGRESHGKCYRLWHEHKPLQESTKPEILRCDLSSVLLDLALWGVEEFDELSWLDIPSTEALKSTKEVLQELEMLDESYAITSFGKDALSLGLHPRFAYMILKANEMGYAYEASLLAALLGEKSILKESTRDSDILPAFESLVQRDFNANYVNVLRAKEVLKQADFFYSKLKKIKKVLSRDAVFQINRLSVLLLLAYPDRLAARRAKNDNRYKLSNGKGALLDVEDSLFNEEYLVVANLNAHVKDSFINQALSISLSEIEEYFTEFIRTQESVTYNSETKKFDIRESRYFLELELSSKPVQLQPEHNMKKLLMTLIQTEGLEFLSWSKKAKSLRDRVNFVNKHSHVRMKDFSDEGLLETLHIWLEPFLSNVKSVKELEILDLYPMLLGLLSWQEQQELELLAPSRVKVPSGSSIFIDYSDIDKPSLSVKIQEMFGLEETPKVLNATMALQIQLLSPAMRPIQITYDLSSFWKNSYAEVRKELRGKYKRHYWPDDPYEAIATKKTKKHMMNKENK
jgi:ATP-dependent RNA helicase HrpB